MPLKRETALAGLRCLAGELRNSRVVLSDRTLIYEFEQTCVWANNDGAKACLSDILKRVEHISLKVREELILS